jgi:superfamily I DNA/RNA helicase
MHAAYHCSGPGSGKTRVLIERVARLISSGVDPSKIAIISFTNKAVDEIRPRLYALGISHASIRQIQLGTFHRFGRANVLEGNEEHFERRRGFLGSNKFVHLNDFLEREGLGRRVGAKFKKAISFIKGHGWTSPDHIKGSDRNWSIFKDEVADLELFHTFRYHERFLESQNQIDIEDYIVKVLLGILIF